MANRNSTTLVLPGNPLGSVLRETAREARRSTRDPNALQYATDTDLAALQAQVTALQDTNTSLQAAVTALQGQVPLAHGLITTDGTGVATFVYPVANPFPFPAVPVIHAMPFVPDNVSCAINSIGPTSCDIAVRNAATGAGYPAVDVFVTIFASNFVP